MNIILIVSDSLRQDHLGCYGNKKINTPHLDEFSKNCIKFNNAFATSFPTMPCRADLFTGKNTFTYLGWNPLTNEETVLAEILQEAGYITAAAVDTPFFIRFGYGYDRGFKDFNFISGQDVALDWPRVISSWRNENDHFTPRTITAADEILEYYYKENFFLYVDTWEPHEPWNPPDYYVKQYRQDYSGKEHKMPSYGNWKEKGLSQDDLDLAHACYCGEITMVDRWVGMFLDKIKKLGIWEDTIIIFTSDHGFCFGEHDLFGKCKISNIDDYGTPKMYTKEYAENAVRNSNSFEWSSSPLYQEITKIPLLMHIPGIDSYEINELVSSVDIMPTILELCDVNIPKSVQGKSIKPLIDKKVDSIRDFAVTSYPLYEVGERSRIVDGRIKAISEYLPATITNKTWSMFYSDNNTSPELYNIKKDPKQLKNIFNENIEVAKSLHSKFFELIEQAGTSNNHLRSRNTIIK